MGAPDNCLLKGGPLPRYMKDTGMFDTISIVSFSSIDTFQANLVWYRYIFQNYVYLLFYSWRIRVLIKNHYLSHCFNKAFLSPLSDNSKLQLCFSWRVIYASATVSASINVTCLTQGGGGGGKLLPIHSLKSLWSYLPTETLK